MRRDMPTLKRTILVSFNAILNLGLSQYVKSFNQSDLTLTFQNGSQIMFMAESYDTDKELNRFKGLEINGGALDEINEIQEVTFYKFLERAGSWNLSPGCPIKVIATCNPSNNWVKEIIYDKWKLGTLKQGWAFVPALITDNPYINKEYLDSLVSNMPEYQYEVFVKGNWDIKLEGVIFGRNELKRYKRSDLNQTPEALLGYADIADEGTDWLSMPVGKIFKGKVFVSDIVFSQANTDVTIPACASLINEMKINFVRVESNNQGSIFIKELRKFVQEDKILKVNNQSNKHTRILLEEMFIKNHFYFLDETEYTAGSPYDLFIRQLLTYMKDGTAEHDDAVDSLSGLAYFVKSFLPHLFE